MLLYVDKKKEKQQKVRRISLVLFCCFFLVINVIQFQSSLQQSAQSLNSYTSIKYLTPWFKKADVVYLFTSRMNKSRAVVLLPAIFNRENFVTTGFAVSMSLRTVHQNFYLGEMHQKQMLEKLVLLLYPQAVFVQDVEKANVVITKNYNEAIQQVLRWKLFPVILNYRHAQRKFVNEPFEKLLARLFPIKKNPATKIEQEKESLRLFAKDYRTAIQDLLWRKQRLDFSHQEAFLQNIRLCLKSSGEGIKCSLSEKLSFSQNLKDILGQMSDVLDVQTLYLLTSDERIFSRQNNVLEADEGLHFSYHNQEVVMLPEEIKRLAKTSDAFYILKEKAGFNPEFNAPEMRFYKFKVMEINYGEEI